uniref:Methyltransferase domain-containing protein n=1 Tax=Anolis carolinensis TaxID=28377 RepID=H9GHQ3_ANOCA|nr:PREDICTED: Williams-Beuren syndrome chromosomal region 27 protein [Anolis carolinensis]|eukprot:XP_003227231.2 PREDICTED: Williams-Beuren syndrome chromosomal region 27 protein [Anolis carolinensis]
MGSQGRGQAGNCRRMAMAVTLSEVRRRVAQVHQGADLEQQLRFYDAWAAEYDEDVSVLEYGAPRFAAACLAAAFGDDPQEALVLDVACGTGRVAQELHTAGFRHFHGLDGSPGMLELARRKDLYQDLKQCLLGQEGLPSPEGCYDAVVIVGALSEGQVPVNVVPELLRVAKPGGFVCMTTRNNRSSLPYKTILEKVLADLEQKGLWEKMAAEGIERWERATSEEESGPGLEYISGVVYLYRKKGRTSVP